MVKQILPDETESWNFWIYSRASRWYQFLIHFKIFLFSTSVTTKKGFRWIGCRRIRVYTALSLWPSNLTQERLLKLKKLPTILHDCGPRPFTFEQNSTLRNVHFCAWRLFTLVPESGIYIWCSIRRSWPWKIFLNYTENVEFQ